LSLRALVTLEASFALFVIAGFNNPTVLHVTQQLIKAVGFVQYQTSILCIGAGRNNQQQAGEHGCNCCFSCFN